jgi:hypothetical protein
VSREVQHSLAEHVLLKLTLLFRHDRPTDVPGHQTFQTGPFIPHERTLIFRAKEVGSAPTRAV